MQDLISRQAVLDWLNDEWDGMVLSVFDGIRELPSAQPDLDSAYTEGYTAAESKYRQMWDEMQATQPEIVRCKECVDYDTSWIPHSAPDRHYCPTMDSFMPDDGYCSYAERRTDEQTD